MKPTTWEFKHFKGKTQIAIYHPKNSFRSLQFEFFQMNEGVFGYLSILQGILPKEPLVNVVIGESRYSYQGKLFEGEQRILLPEDATKMIVNSLVEGHDVIIKCSHYVAKLEASGTSIRGSTLKAI